MDVRNITPMPQDMTGRYAWDVSPVQRLLQPPPAPSRLLAAADAAAAAPAHATAAPVEGTGSASAVPLPTPQQLQQTPSGNSAGGDDSDKQGSADSDAVSAALCPISPSSLSHRLIRPPSFGSSERALISLHKSPIASPPGFAHMLYPWGGCLVPDASRNSSISYRPYRRERGACPQYSEDTDVSRVDVVEELLALSAPRMLPPASVSLFPVPVYQPRGERFWYAGPCSTDESFPDVATNCSSYEGGALSADVLSRTVALVDAQHSACVAAEPATSSVHHTMPV